MYKTETFVQRPASTSRRLQTRYTAVHPGV